ncbi:hypothetical protein SEVIR_8G157001v4 [Setaria viridis]
MRSPHPIRSPSRSSAPAMRSPRPLRSPSSEVNCGKPSIDVGVSSRTRSRWHLLSSLGLDPAAAPPNLCEVNRSPNCVQDNENNHATVKVQLRKEEEHFKTRFSVHRIRDLLPNLEDHQKQWINEAGVGALLTLAEFSLPVKLVKWMLKHVDPLLREFRYRNKVIVFNRDLVCKILGLQNGIIPLRLSSDSEDVKKLREVYKDGDRAKIAKCKEIVQSSKDRDSFVRAFSLLALGTIYTP